jgi:hypothetical protein
MVCNRVEFPEIGTLGCAENEFIDLLLRIAIIQCIANERLCQTVGIIGKMLRSVELQWQNN